MIICHNQHHDRIFVYHVPTSLQHLSLLNVLANDCYAFDVDILADSVNHCEAADSAQACQEQCQKEEHCQEFTFITNANEKDQNCCHIESRTEGNEQTVTGFVSGPKFCGNTNLRCMQKLIN